MDPTSDGIGGSLAILLCWVLFVAVPAASPLAGQAQSYERAHLRPSAAPAPEQEASPTFGRILLGSAIGTSVGTGVGLVLLQTVAEMERRGDPYGVRDPSEEDAEMAVLLAGATAIIGGGPVGAVEMGGIDARRTDAYVTAVLGEILLGAAVYGLSRGLSDRQGVRLGGLGIGAALGAASGAYLISQQSQPNSLIHVRSGRWGIAAPTVQVDPNIGGDRPPEVGISLLTVHL